MTLATRVPEAPTGTEAGELGVALNQMLGRIEEAFDERTRSEDRLRRFVGDASHELRTPVTTIRGYAELYRAGGLEEGDELREAMRRTEQEAIRMGRLVDDLLLLARLDQGRPLEQVPVRLEVLVEDAVRDARAVDPQRAITATIDHRATVLGDDGRLRQVVGNLVRNATGAHARRHAGRTCAVDRTTESAILEVHDDGPGHVRTRSRRRRSNASTAPIRRVCAAAAGAGSGSRSSRRPCRRTAAPSYSTPEPAEGRPSASSSRSRPTVSRPHPPDAPPL